MLKVDVHEARTDLSRLLLKVEQGEEVVISRSGKPVARLIPIDQPGTRRLGIDEGVFEVPEDFDAPLSGDVLAGFES